MAKNFTTTQLKELLDMHENTIVKIFSERIEKVFTIRGENKELKREMNDLKKAMDYQNEKYENVVKELQVEKERNTDSEKDILKMRELNVENERLEDKMAELEDRSRRNNLRIDGLDEKEGET